MVTRPGICDQTRAVRPPVFREDFPMRKGLNFFLMIALALSFVLSGQSAMAQRAQAAAGETEGRAAGGPRKQLATIIYAGLGGAVLGLSTLSFYGRPQDKLANIAIGFAVGVIVGTSVVTYNAATNPDEFYGPSGDDRQSWRYRSEDEGSLANQSPSSAPEPLKISYMVEF